MQHNNSSKIGLVRLNDDTIINIDNANILPSSNPKNLNTDTYKQTPIGLIPIDWEVKKLGDVIQLSSGKTKPNDLENVLNEHKKFPVYGGNGIMGFSEQFNSKDEIIIIGRVGEYCGITRYINEHCWITDNALFTKKFLEEINVKFLAFKLQFEDLAKLRSKGGQPLISQNPIYIHSVSYPKSLPEQQKIANILSTWDAAIDNCKAIIEKLQQRNKGLAQQLLTGKMRVKGFEKTKWSNLKLSDFSINRNSSLSINNLEGNIGEYPLYGANRIIQRIDFYESEEPYVSIIKDGAGVGRVFLCEAKSSVVGTMAYIKPNEKSTLNFLFYLLQIIKYENFITGSTIPHIYYSSYGNTFFEIPSIEEQKAIANILDAATAELNQYQQKLQTLQHQKKGLMQQLLTGKTRVKV
jgi:type I restriction enzyme, S subunit